MRTNSFYLSPTIASTPVIKSSDELFAVRSNLMSPIFQKSPDTLNPTFSAISQSCRHLPSKVRFNWYDSAQIASQIRRRVCCRIVDQDQRTMVFILSEYTTCNDYLIINYSSFIRRQGMTTIFSLLIVIIIDDNRPLSYSTPALFHSVQRRDRMLLIMNRPNLLIFSVSPLQTSANIYGVR